MGTALITGASSGIGADLARQFHAAGHAVILVARRGDRLENLARELGAGARVLVADLADPASPGRIYAETGPVDILINNAGFGDFGAFSAQDASRQQSMIAVNIAALTALTHLYLPAMVERRAGRILNVASIVGFMPCPGIAVYAATKAYVLSLSESLAEELRGSGVSVTALCPGITATPMLHQAADANSALAALPALLVGDVADVAAQGFAACMRGDVIVVPGLVNRAATAGGRLLPKWLLRRVSGLVSRRLK